MVASIETLLNLACIKFTGHPLPCDADVVREWSYTLDDKGKKRGKFNAFAGTLLHNPLASGLGQYPIEHAIKRSIITDTIDSVNGKHDITYEQIATVMRGHTNRVRYVFTYAEEQALSDIGDNFIYQKDECKKIKYHHGQQRAKKFGDTHLSGTDEYSRPIITDEDKDVIYILLLGNPALRQVLFDLTNSYDRKGEKARIIELKRGARNNAHASNHATNTWSNPHAGQYRDAGINKKYPYQRNACWGENSNGTIRRFKDVAVRYDECPTKRDLWTQYFYAVMSHKINGDIVRSNIARSNSHVNWWRHVKEQGLIEDEPDFTKEYYNDKAQKHQTKIIQSIMNL